MSGRITAGFREIIEMRWSEFVLMEANAGQSNFDSIVSSLVRACTKGNLRAIQTSLDRLDGKVATEIEVEYPKFYTLYPQATKTADSPLIIDGDSGTTPVASVEKTEPEPVVPEELPTGSLRSVLDRMLDSPKKTVLEILGSVELVDEGDLSKGNPLVKSVIIAGLMKLVHEGKVSAIFEILEQIDGKVADKFKILGSDVFMYNYVEIAPAGAEKNEDGIYQISADNTTDSWVSRLEERNDRKNNR